MAGAKIRHALVITRGNQNCTRVREREKLKVLVLQEMGFVKRKAT